MPCNEDLKLASYGIGSFRFEVTKLARVLDAHLISKAGINQKVTFTYYKLKAFGLTNDSVKVWSLKYLFNIKKISSDKLAK